MSRIEELLDWLIPVIFLIVVLTGTVGVGMGIDYWSCVSKWEKSGMGISWGPMQGCLINKDGAWIPTENYREIP